MNINTVKDFAGLAILLMGITATCTLCAAVILAPVFGYSLE